MIDLSVNVGANTFTSPVMTAAGTSGYGDELAGYGDLSQLGAVVTKSLTSYPWTGNPAPRVAAWGEHMLNAVGLSGPGVTAWRRDDLTRLAERGATVVASVWGRSISDFAEAIEQMRGAEVAAIEINVSCPNLEDRSRMFAHSPRATAEVIAACREAEVPLWVKLSPNTPDLLEVAQSAVDAGAEALVLVNTLLGLVVDLESRRPALGNGGGGLSGPGLHPVALRAVYECRAAMPTIPIVGVGGVASGEDAVAMIMAGANAVEVGTATFADPRAPWRVQRELTDWLARHDCTSPSQIWGAAHG